MDSLLSKMFFFCLVVLLFSANPAMSAEAKTAVSCHCFQNRSYNPGDKFAADEYLLATSFNSLIAKSFTIPKREVVMLKMKGGVSQDDLLIALYVAKVSGVEIGELLSLRRSEQTWQTILAGPTMIAFVKQDPFLAGLNSARDFEQAGGRVADNMIIDFFKEPAAKIAELHAAGLNEKEVAVVLLLGHILKKSPQQFTEKRIAGKSWGQIAADYSITPVGVGELMLNYQQR